MRLGCAVWEVRELGRGGERAGMYFVCNTAGIIHAVWMVR